MDGRFRRIFPVSACTGEGHLAEPISDVQPARRGPLFMPLSSHPARRRAGLGQWNLVIRSLVGEGGLGAGQSERLRRSLLAQLVWQYRGVYLPGQDHSMFAVRCHATG
jgi:hypothetical protein